MLNYRSRARVVALFGLSVVGFAGCKTYKAIPFDGGADENTDGATPDAALPDTSGDVHVVVGDTGSDRPATDGAGSDAVVNQCQDGTKNGSETDVDCGGSCPKCARDQACGVDGDCTTGSCVRFFCALVSGPPNWLPGPSLNIGRGLGSLGVEPLTGRKMLLVAIGGRDDSGSDNVSGTYELLDTTVASPAWAAQEFTLPNGMIGYGEPTVTDSLGRILTFSFDGMWSYTGNTLWQTSTSMVPTPRDQAGAAVAPNGFAYVVGGSVQRFDAGTGIIEAYNATTNIWKTGLTAMPTPRAGLACATGGDGRIYALGGLQTASNGGLSTVGTVEAYDPTANSWASLSELPDPAWELAAVGGPDGRVYAIGGNTTNGLPLATVNAYSAVTNRWSPVVPIDVARFGVAAAVDPNGHIWAVGGTTNPETPGFTTVLVYGPNPSVAPAAAASGAMASVTGSNFAANATVSVYFGSTTTAAVGTGTTNAAGALTTAISFRVPNLAAGEQALIVMDDRSQFPITLSFRVQ